jgi:hypothetical protein
MGSSGYIRSVLRPLLDSAGLLFPNRRPVCVDDFRITTKEEAMAKVDPYHTTTPENRPGHRDVYHDQNDCHDGQNIANPVPGKADRPQCDECQRLDSSKQNRPHTVGRNC